MIARIARTSAMACMAMAVIFGAWRGSIIAAFSVVGGGLLIGFSFWAIGTAIDDLTFRFPAQKRPKTAVFTLVKFFTRHAIVALAAYGMMVRLHLDPVGLLAGVSSVGVAAGVEALRDLKLRWRRFL